MSSDRNLPTKVYTRLVSVHKRKHYCEVVAVYPDETEMSVMAPSAISPSLAQSNAGPLMALIAYLTPAEVRQL